MSVCLFVCLFVVLSREREREGAYNVLLVMFCYG